RIYLWGFNAVQLFIDLPHVSQDLIVRIHHHRLPPSPRQTAVAASDVSGLISTERTCEKAHFTTPGSKSFTAFDFDSLDGISTQVPCHPSRRQPRIGCNCLPHSSSLYIL